MLTGIKGGFNFILLLSLFIYSSYGANVRRGHGIGAGAAVVGGIVDDNGAVVGGVIGAVGAVTGTAKGSNRTNDSERESGLLEVSKDHRGPTAFDDGVVSENRHTNGGYYTYYGGNMVDVMEGTGSEGAMMSSGDGRFATEEMSSDNMEAIAVEEMPHDNMVDNVVLADEPSPDDEEAVVDAEGSGFNVESGVANETSTLDEAPLSDNSTSTGVEALATEGEVSPVNGTASNETNVVVTENKTSTSEGQPIKVITILGLHRPKAVFLSGREGRLRRKFKGRKGDNRRGNRRYRKRPVVDNDDWVERRPLRRNGNDRDDRFDRFDRFDYNDWSDEFDDDYLDEWLDWLEREEDILDDQCDDIDDVFDEDCRRRRQELERIREEIFGPRPGQQGFNQQGFNQQGFNPRGSGRFRRGVGSAVVGGVADASESIANGVDKTVDAATTAGTKENGDKSKEEKKSNGSGIGGAIVGGIADASKSIAKGVDDTVKAAKNESETTTTTTTTTTPKPEEKTTSSNSTCKSQDVCYGDSDCGDGKCVGVFVGTCNCNACFNFMTCTSDEGCGGLKGACDMTTKRCNCQEAHRKLGYANYFDALTKFCNHQACNATSDSCNGLPCNSGRCFC